MIKKEEPVSRKAMAAILVVGPTQLDRYVEQGCPCEPNKKYLPSAVVQWREDRRREKEQAAERKKKKADAEIKDLKTRTQQRELAMSLKRGELHPIDKCKESLGELLASIASELKALPQRLQTAFPEVPKLKDVAIREVNRSFEQIREYAKTHAGKSL